MEPKNIHTDKAPSPVANYSQALRVGDLVFLSGQGAFDAETGALVGSDIMTQTRKTLENIGFVLVAAGLNHSHVISIRYFISSWDLFKEMNVVHAEFFNQQPFPVRTTVEVGLAPGMLVEIDAIALHKN
jgi:reactive intermediate/imine deaminase